MSGLYRSLSPTQARRRRAPSGEPQKRLQGKARLVVVAGGFAVLTAILALSWRDGAPKPLPSATITISSPVPVPQEWFSPQWESILSAEAPTSEWLALDAVPSDVAAPVQARQVARDALKAKLTGDAGSYTSYLQDPFEGDPALFEDKVRGTCRDVVFRGANPMALSGQLDVAKVAVVWGGDCVDGLTDEALRGAPRDPKASKLSFVYLKRDGAKWVPVRLNQLDGSASGVQLSGEVPDPALLAQLRCGDEPIEGRARLEVVEAFAAMCQAALADGVSLEVTSSLRSEAEQKARFEQARKVQGEARARSEVAWQDGRCASRHCAGWALDIAGQGALGWLSQPVGCQDYSGKITSASKCGEGLNPVSRAVSWGFAQPLGYQPDHLEYALSPAEIPWVANCSPPPWMSVPEQISAIWHCRLGETGMAKEQVRLNTAKALVVSQCASGWNPEAVEAGGRYVSVPDPRTGKVRDGTGVFQLPPSVVHDMNAGVATNAVDNIDAAARWFLTQKDFGSWACSSELQKPLPDWAFRY